VNGGGLTLLGALRIFFAVSFIDTENSQNRVGMPDAAEAKVQTFRQVALLREGTRARSAVVSVLYEEEENRIE